MARARQRRRFAWIPVLTAVLLLAATGVGPAAVSDATEQDGPQPAQVIDEVNPFDALARYLLTHPVLFVPLGTG